MKRIVFIVTEDWFFVSHFLPMVTAAKENGCEVFVIARVRKHRAEIEATGAILVPFEAERGSLNPFIFIISLWRLVYLLKNIQPHLVHCVALRAIFVGGLAARLANIGKRFYAVTGLGFLGANSSLKAKTALWALTIFLKRILDGRHVHYIFENPDDPVSFGFNLNHHEKLTILGGAGVDPDKFSVHPLPIGQGLKVAFVSRMLWSKGPDLAVKAVLMARELGADVKLSLYGLPDHSNPKAITANQLHQWSCQSGIKYYGRAEDMNVLWQNYHLCILPSRGGEGLPRVLLEAASCARAILTTNVPGCRFLVRDGIEGAVVAPNDVSGLALKLIELSANHKMLQEYGKAARARVEQNFTISCLCTTMTKLYNRYL
jgi:glycosyltransferase involved in cell wall biosynthesis